MGDCRDIPSAQGNRAILLHEAPIAQKLVQLPRTACNHHAVQAS